MKKRGFAFLLALMLILPLTFAAAADNTALTTEIDTYLKKYKTAGAAVLVAKDGETVYTRYFGYAKKKTEEKISSQTYFRIASVSKLVSGIHVMQLVEQGLLDLDTDISEYLGYKVQNPYYPDNPLTLRMIMSHTTSLKSNGGYVKIQLGLRELISADKPHRGNYYREKPGSKYRYSNFGAGIMGSLIESVTGKNLNDSITESLFGPLNMDAAYSPSLLKYPANVPVIYKPGGIQAGAEMSIAEGWDEKVNPDKHFRITSGGVWIKAADMMRLVQMLCDGGELEGQRILQPETVAMMMAEQKGQGAVTADTPYGLCLYRAEDLVPGKTLYGHQGMSGAILANVYFEPESRFCFVLLTNGCKNAQKDHTATLARRLVSLTWDAFGE